MQALNDYFVREFGLPPLKITKDVWPQFGYDILTQPEWGLQHFYTDTAIESLVGLYDRWRNGQRPSETEFKRILDLPPETNKSRSVGVVLAICGLNNVPDRINVDRKNSHAVFSVIDVARISAEQRKPASKKEWEAIFKDHLHKQYAHLQTLLTPTKSVTMEFLSSAQVCCLPKRRAFIA